MSSERGRRWRGGAALVGALLGGCLGCGRTSSEPPAVITPEVRPPAASASQAAMRLPSASVSAAVAAVASSGEPGTGLLPDGCPAPPRDVMGIDALVDPLGPARIEATVTPPRCYPASIEFKRFMSPRFALAVDVPAFLEPYAMGSGNGDGGTFILGREMELRAWGSHNHLLGEGKGEEATRVAFLKEARETAPGERLVSVTREGNSITRISVLAGRRTMTRTIHEDGLSAAVSIEYDESLSAYFLPIEDRVRQSLRTTSGGMYDRPRKPNRRYPRD